MNTQGNKEAQEEIEKSPESKVEHMELCDLNEREFRA